MANPGSPFDAPHQLRYAFGSRARGFTLSQIVNKLSDGTFDEATLAAALGLRGDDQAALFELARRIRREHFPGSWVEVRSVVEVSNVCHQKCNYCSIGSATLDAEYVIGQEDFLEIVGHVHARGRRCLLVQSGENRAPEFIDAVCAYVAETRRRFPDMAIILCLGNLSRGQYAELRKAGGDRYILKFETSNPVLYRRSKPNDTLERRLECLHQLHELGFGLGTGNIVGLPGQSTDDLVADLRFLGGLPLAMMSCSAFIPGEQTPYRDHPPVTSRPPSTTWR